MTLLSSQKLSFILGPCGIESRDQCLRIASELARCAQALGIDIIFKASFDKANRTRHDSFRGPGLHEGLRILDDAHRASGLAVLTDIHEPTQARTVAEVAQVLQIPAFLCRQTDLLVAAAQTGRAVHVKKGQFLAPDDMSHVRDKLAAHGAHDIWLCERGTHFGHHDLVVDMRGLVVMRDIADEIPGGRLVFDATHAAQSPSNGAGQSGGDRRWVPALARAAVAVGVDAVFAEVHPNPTAALSDAATQWPLDHLKALLQHLIALDQTRRALIPLCFP